MGVKSLTGSLRASENLAVAFEKSSTALSASLSSSCAADHDRSYSPDQPFIPQKIIVDGNSFMHHCAKNVNWAGGSSYSTLENAASLIAQRFLQLFTSEFVLFIFDGPLPSWKVQHRIQREQHKINLAKSILADVFNRRNPSIETSLISPLCISVTIYALRKQGCRVLFADGEADLLIAEKAREMQDACVISTDSDFAIHNLGVNGGYIPFESFEFIESTEGLTMKGRVWFRRNTAMCLMIKFVPSKFYFINNLLMILIIK